MTEFFGQIIFAFQTTWYILVPVTSYVIFRSLWGRYVCVNDFYSKQNEIILELIPPRDIEKSPKIMEGFFDSLAGTDAGVNVINKYCHCAQNPFFSLEIVGTEGVAHFYVRTPAFFRNLVESALYSRYPDLEITEVDDYTKHIPQAVPNDEWTLWGSDLGLIKPDAYPIKTYKYFEEDITGTMIDPLANMMEAISNLGPGQHIWLQYVIQADRPNWFNEWGKGTVEEFLGKVSKPQSFGARVAHDLKEVVGGVFTGWLQPPTLSSLDEPKSDDQPLEFRLTPGEKQVLKSIEENIGKHMFQVNCRLIIVGRKDFFSKVNVSAAMGAIKQFADNHTNQFYPIDRGKTYADYFAVEHRLSYRMRKILRRYRDRDDTGFPFHLSSEELATVFHLPDTAVSSPSVQRADSRRGGAPSNLPLGE
jgi:hypothetical protein